MKNPTKTHALALASLASIAFAACGSKSSAPAAGLSPTTPPVTAPLPNYNLPTLPQAPAPVLTTPDQSSSLPPFSVQTPQQPDTMIVQVAYNQDGIFMPETADIRALTAGAALPANNAAITSLWSSAQPVKAQGAVATAGPGVSQNNFLNQGNQLKGNQFQGNQGFPQVQGNQLIPGTGADSAAQGAQGIGGFQQGHRPFQQNLGFGQHQNGIRPGAQIGGARFGQQQGGVRSAQAWGSVFNGYTSGTQWSALRPVIAWSGQQLSGFAYNSFYASQGFGYFTYRPQTFAAGFNYQIGLSAGLNSSWLSGLNLGGIQQVGFQQGGIIQQGGYQQGGVIQQGGFQGNYQQSGSYQQGYNVSGQIYPNQGCLNCLGN